MNYADIDAVNCSTLKELWAKSPKHYLYRLEHPRPETPALRLGIATHCAVLEPLRFADEYAAEPVWQYDGRTKDGKAERAEWREQCDGRIVLPAAEHAACLAMAEAVASDLVAAVFMQPGKVEHAIKWTDRETGIKCKGRLDLLTDTGILVGLKTARDASERGFATSAARYGYHLQWAFYYDGLAALGFAPGRVVEIVVETSPPYDVIVYEVEDDTLDEGRQAYREALCALKTCRHEDVWPGRARSVVTFALPRWAQQLDDDEGALDGLNFGGEDGGA